MDQVVRVSDRDCAGVGRRLGVLASALGLIVSAGAAWADQVLVDETFESEPYGNWLANGNQFVFDGGNPGFWIGVPYLDFWGVELRHENPSSFGMGDLSGYPEVRVSVDVQVLALDNFFGQAMDPGLFPLVLELIDEGDPNDFLDDCSVYTIGPGMPTQASGWSRVEYVIPAPTSSELPVGWGGTGAEDPVSFEPILPTGRTYASVLASVDRIRISTFVPGFFYGASFWEAGFDNLKIVVPGSCPCPLDYDNSGSDIPDISDLLAFFDDFGAGIDRADVDCTGPGSVPDIDDVIRFFEAFNGGC